MQDPAFIEQLFDLVKHWGPIAAGFWAAFKIIEAARTIKTSDLPAIKQSIDALEVALKDQTTSLVAEFREMRQDFRSFYAPPRPARAARAPRASRSTIKKEK